MATPFENVRGCVLTIEDLHSSISFATPSDALFSSLFIKYTDIVPMNFFDDLLALFWHKDFHSDQVTMQKPESFMDHIASQRQLIAKERNSKSPDLQDVDSRLACYPQTPTLIPELLAEYLDAEKLPFHRALELVIYGKPINCEAKRTLEAMSLVHRSWTDIAQRYLHRRIYIMSSDMLPSVFLSPKIGPWVRHLSFYNGSYVCQPVLSTLQMPRLLTGIMKRCPNITHLGLQMYGLPPDKDSKAEMQAYKSGYRYKAPYDIILQLADMKHLEHLWLHQSTFMDFNHDDVWKLTTGLPGLHFLKSLAIYSLDVPWWRKEQEPMNDSAPLVTPIPSSSFETLSLVKVNETDTGLFTWLMNPHNHITRLELSLPIGLDKPRRATTTHVRTLQFVSLRNAVDVSLRNTVDIGIALEFFPSVQTLSLHVDREQGLSGISLVLPATIRNVHFHYCDPRETDVREQDQIALAALTTYRHVQRMFITYCESFHDTVTGLPSHALFKDSAEYCTMNNVEFKVTNVEYHHPPHISELIAKAGHGKRLDRTSSSTSGSTVLNTKSVCYICTASEDKMERKKEQASAVSGVPACHTRSANGDGKQ